MFRIFFFLIYGFSIIFYSLSCNAIYAFDFWLVFKFSSFFVKNKANSTIELRKLRSHEKRDRLLVSKVEFTYRLSQRIFFKSIDPVFFQSVLILSKKVNHKLF